MPDITATPMQDNAMSQIPVISGNQAGFIASRPFAIYSGTDLTGTATGNINRENYCGLESTSASRYRLNRADHNNIYQFTLNSSFYNGPTYCLDKFKDGPYGDVPYRSNSFEALFPNATTRQKLMLAWILANGYPSVSAGETFTLAGVDAAAAPVLDNNDAYAVVQIAIWVLLGQIAPDEVYFLDCTTGAVHPKSDRLRAAVLSLLEKAGAYADAASQPPTPANTSSGSTSRKTVCCGSTPSCGEGHKLIECCNKGTFPSDAAAPYLVFHGCPDEVRCVCGRLLIGPFMLRSSFTGTPSLSIEPVCSCEQNFSASFMDFCGNAISSPSIGQEFYIAIRSDKNCICFYLNASYRGTISRVITMGPTSTALNYQPIGSAVLNLETVVTASICVCVTNPGLFCGGSGSPEGPKGSKGSSSCSQFTANASQNTNISQSFSNAQAQGILVIPAIGGMPPSCPGWCCPPAQPPYPPFPPYPPTPPYPPMPPYPPQPPYPPMPPYPPKPPYPPEPPYPPKPPYPPMPPYPPKPPYPPEPPYPPIPPCPPEPPYPPMPPYPPCPPWVCWPPQPPCGQEPECPPKPPCKPESECPPKPPCKPEPECPPKPTCEPEPCCCPPKPPCEPEPCCCPPKPPCEPEPCCCPPKPPCEPEPCCCPPKPPCEPEPCCCPPKPPCEPEPCCPVKPPCKPEPCFPQIPSFKLF